MFEARLEPYLETPIIQMEITFVAYHSDGNYICFCLGMIRLIWHDTYQRNAYNSLKLMMHK
jgi:hypothetical protein